MCQLFVNAIDLLCVHVYIYVRNSCIYVYISAVSRQASSAVISTCHLSRYSRTVETPLTGFTTRLLYYLVFSTELHMHRFRDFTCGLCWKDVQPAKNLAIESPGGFPEGVCPHFRAEWHKRRPQLGFGLGLHMLVVLINRCLGFCVVTLF